MYVATCFWAVTWITPPLLVLPTFGSISSNALAKASLANEEWRMGPLFGIAARLEVSSLAQPILVKSFLGWDVEAAQHLRDGTMVACRDIPKFTSGFARLPVFGF
eukprot:TRINITY_DN70022_c0_g1_i1.p3 TRINITY_DN70022_c0_g1~~TRINITY_DN70022_c0_g1_i1.p3  ORF type:complete len:105 (-),score=12.58 TRINITY_DN70022_c0_g1_i1:20-334(-)